MNNDINRKKVPMVNKCEFQKKSLRMTLLLLSFYLNPYKEIFRISDPHPLLSNSIVLRLNTTWSE